MFRPRHLVHKARQGQGKVGQDKARQGKARQLVDNRRHN